MPITGFLEVCAFTVQSCIIAQRAGAARVELCDNPVEGGTTPSYGTVRRARERIDIRLYPIIRPRSGNYYYDEDEFEIIRQDIAACKDLGCNGISVGVGYHRCGNRYGADEAHRGMGVSDGRHLQPGVRRHARPLESPGRPRSSAAASGCSPPVGEAALPMPAIYSPGWSSRLATASA